MVCHPNSLNLNVESQGDLPWPNSPAKYHFTLSVGYTPLDDFAERVVNLVFSANGTLELTRTSPEQYETARTLLEPTVSELAQISPEHVNHFWRMVIWLFVSYYNVYLADLGQTEVHTYQPLKGQYLMPVNFSAPSALPTRNNVFRNPELFDNYNGLLSEFVLALNK